MDKFFDSVLLFDFYGDLLTEKQRRAYNMYYNDNLSLSEIADELSITRQGVREFLRRSEEAMLRYESVISLIKKHNERRDRIEVIISKLRPLLGADDDAVNGILNEIRGLGEI